MEAAAARAARRSAEKKKRRGDDADEDVGIVFGLFRWLGAGTGEIRTGGLRGLVAAPIPDEEFVQTPKGVEHVSGARGGVIAVLQPDLRARYATTPPPRRRRRPRRARRVCPRDGF